MLTVFMLIAIIFLLAKTNVICRPDFRFYKYIFYDVYITGE